MPDLRDEQRALAEHHRWYAGVIARLREQVDATVPPGARVAVISKGDEELVQLGDRVASHFPQTDTGLFAGFHPADGAEAVAHLHRVRDRGVQYLVVPASARWWLDHYPELGAHLDEHASVVADDAEGCRIYALAPAAAASAPAGADGAGLEAAQVAPAVAAWLHVLLPLDAEVVAIGPAAPALQLGERPVRRLADPERADDVAAALDAAARAGVRYAVLVPPQDRRERDAAEPARAALAARGRLIAAQALAELYELRAAEPAAAPRRRGLLKLIRNTVGRPDA